MWLGGGKELRLETQIEAGVPTSDTALDVTKKHKSWSHSSKNSHSNPGKVFLRFS